MKRKQKRAKPNLHMESAPGHPQKVGDLREGRGSVQVAAPQSVFSYSSVLPDGFEVAIGHTYPTSCVQGDKVLRYSAVCIAYDESTQLAMFEVRAGQHSGWVRCSPASQPKHNLSFSSVSFALRSL